MQLHSQICHVSMKQSHHLLVSLSFDILFCAAHFHLVVRSFEGFGWQQNKIFHTFDLLCKALTTTPTITANTLRVQLVGQNSLLLREVMIFDRSGINVALDKPATQSSSPYGNRQAPNANNGNLEDHSATQNDPGEHC